jgi:hypothetical protein
LNFFLKEYKKVPRPAPVVSAMSAGIPPVKKSRVLLGIKQAARLYEETALSARSRGIT